MKLATTITTIAAVAVTLVAPAFGQDKVLNLYSSRHYQTDEALYANFTKQTGIRVNRLTGDVSQWQDGSVLVLPGLLPSGNVASVITSSGVSANLTTEATPSSHTTTTSRTRRRSGC